MRKRNFVVVGLVGLASLAFNVATAEDAVGPSPAYAVNGVSFADPAEERSFAEGGRLDISFNEDGVARFLALSDDTQSTSADVADRRGYEVSVTASTRLADVSFAQRGALAVDENGDISGRSQGSELRLGRGLANLRRDQPSRTPIWYFFAASDDEALVWRPGSRREFGGQPSGFALQDRVEIGDLQAGITYEHGRMQASLAYVEREISVRTAGSHTISSDESFAGLTLTMRH